MPPLSPPTNLVYQAELEPEFVAPTELVRISAYPDNEPYFDKRGRNRFDDPLRAFGTCYLGFSLLGAFAETVLHNASGQNGFTLEADELDRWVHYFDGEPLKLARLLGPDLKALGADGELSTTSDYAMTQAWSAEIHANFGQFDGFRYVSKHCNTEHAVVLFDRAKSKIRAQRHIALPDHEELDAVLRAFKVAVDGMNLTDDYGPKYGFP